MNRVFGQLLCSSMAAALLAGCGGSQPPIGVPEVMGQSVTVGAQEHGGSWMLSQAKGKDLLYIMGDKPPKVYILTYPDGDVVGTINQEYESLCSDKSGNVFMTSGTQSVAEYRHGSIKPFKILRDHDKPFTCSVDPLSGDLAVSNPYKLGEYPGDVVIYRNAQGKAQAYKDPNFYVYTYVAYDASGDSSSRARGPARATPLGWQSFLAAEAHLLTSR